MIYPAFALFIVETAFHEVSVYPKKELPFFLVFTAVLCSVTALLAFLTYRYPDTMGHIAKTVSLSFYLRFIC